MLEAFGDSTRDGEWAAVRLRIQGERIVEADADGLAERLDGLSLLEAAAVPGETLAADALANALGPVFRAAPSPTRAAVAMSGGVDSAVALLRARPDAIGVTLRLWLDPLVSPQLATVATMLLVCVLVLTNTVSADGSISGMYRAGIQIAERAYTGGSGASDSPDIDQDGVKGFVEG